MRYIQGGLSYGHPLWRSRFPVYFKLSQFHRLRRFTCRRFLRHSRRFLLRPGGHHIQDQWCGICWDFTAVNIFSANYIGKLNAETCIGERRVQRLRLRGFHIQPAGRGISVALGDIAADGFAVLHVTVHFGLKNGDLFGDAQCVQP